MNLEQFLDRYGVEYTIQGDRIVTNERRIRLENKGTTGLPLWELALMYRTITGCCSASTQEFLEINKLPDYLSINDVKKSMDGRNTDKCFLRLLSKLRFLSKENK